MDKIPERIWFDPVFKTISKFQGEEYKIEFIPKSIADADYNEALREGHNQGYKEGWDDARRNKWGIVE